MKTKWLVLFSWLLLAVPVVVRAQFTFATNNGALTVTSYTGSSGAVDIPDSTNGLPVTSVGDYAFNDCTGLTSVIIGNGVTSIGQWTFAQCSSLTNVVLGRNVTSIGNAAFEECWFLASITFPASVTSIGYGAFYECDLSGIYFAGNAPSDDSTEFAFNNAFSYVNYLPGTTGWGATFGGLATAPWMLPYPVILNNAPGFGMQSNQFSFTVSWATNLSVVVEACTNLANPVWLPQQTNALNGGTNYFSDAQSATYGSRFYRVHAQ